MIPLFFINKKENMLIDSTISISEVKPIYRHAGNILEFEFKYNLDSFFYLKIMMNEFDQPKYIYLKTNKESAWTKVEEKQQEYTLDSNYIVMTISYDDIVKLANNCITVREFKDIDIKSKMFNVKIDKNVFVDRITFNDYIENLTVQLNGKKLFYYFERQNTKPVLTYAGKTLKLAYIKGNYYVFDLELDGEDYQVALIHIHGFRNHYLFRETNLTHDIILDSSSKKIILADGTTIDKHDGLFYVDEETTSYQKYYTNSYGEEYKQYIDNAVTDRNLYTEISRAFNVAKHHSFNVFDLKNNLRLIGKVSASFQFNKEHYPELVVGMDKIRDQFGNSINKKIEFRIPLPKLDAAVREFAKHSYNLYEYGYFVVDGNIEVITPAFISNEETAYLTASNKDFFFSVSIDYLYDIHRKQLNSTMPTIKQIHHKTYLSPLISLKYIDYENNKVCFSNVNTYEEIKFEDISNYKFIVTPDNNELLAVDGPINIFGLELKSKLNKIEFNCVTPDLFNQIMLEIANVEPYEYQYETFVKDCKFFGLSARLSFIDRDFIIIYNAAKDYVYFIDMLNQDVSKITTEQLESHEMYFDVSNIDELKSMLAEGKITEFLVKNEGFGGEVANNLDVYPYVVYEDLGSSEVTKSTDNTTLMDMGNTSNNNNMAKAYQYSKNILKEVIKGVFVDNTLEMLKAEITDDIVNITLENIHTKEVFNKKIEIKQDGTAFVKNLLGSKHYYPAKEVKGAKDTYGHISYLDVIGSMSSLIAIDINVFSKFLEKGMFNYKEGRIKVSNNEYSCVITSKQPLTAIDVKKVFNFEYNKTSEKFIKKEWLDESIKTTTLHKLEKYIPGGYLDDVMECVDRDNVYTLLPIPTSNHITHVK